MPNDSTVAKIICPYFDSLKSKEIKCIQCENIKIERTFNTREEKNYYLKTYCETYSWEFCKIAKWAKKTGKKQQSR